MSALCGALLLFSTVSVAAQSAPTPTRTPTRTLLPTFTPSATLAPIQPTATSAYAGIKLTPTPFPTPVPNNTLVSAFQAAMGANTLADTAINFYRVLNFGGAADVVSFIVVGMIVYLYVVRLSKRLNNRIDD